MKEGKLKIRAALSGFIQVSGKEKYSLPKEYIFENRDLHNKMCQFELNDNNMVITIIVDGNTLPKSQAVLERKEKEKKRLIEDRKRKEEEKKKAREEEKARKGNSNNKTGNDTFSLNHCLPPLDTKNSGIISSEVDNFHLKLNKFPRFEVNEKNYSKSGFSFHKSNRGKQPNQIVANYGNINFKELATRQMEAAQAICSNNINVLNSNTSWKLVNGLGGHSVYETSITLHHIYGFPYIPASSIKGVVRSWIITEVFGNSESGKVPNNEKKHPLLNAECRAYQNEIFCKIFGCPASTNEIQFDEKGEPRNDKKGKYITKPIDVSLKNKDGKGESNIGNIIFFDAYPITKPHVESDIMNPHYSEYYQDSNNKKRIAPTDNQKPIPIFFLIVKNTSFQFIVGSKDEHGLDWAIEGKSIKTWLQSALTDHGIGAKTAVGYGYFS